MKYDEVILNTNSKYATRYVQIKKIEVNNNFNKIVFIKDIYCL